MLKTEHPIFKLYLIFKKQVIVFNKTFVQCPLEPLHAKVVNCSRCI